MRSQKLQFCEFAQILREGSGTKGKSAQILCAVSIDTDYSLYAELRNHFCGTIRGLISDFVGLSCPSAKHLERTLETGLGQLFSSRKKTNSMDVNCVSLRAVNKF